MNIKILFELFNRSLINENTLAGALNDLYGGEVKGKASPVMPKPITINSKPSLKDDLIEKIMFLKSIKDSEGNSVYASDKLGKMKLEEINKYFLEEQNKKEENNMEVTNSFRLEDANVSETILPLKDTNKETNAELRDDLAKKIALIRSLKDGEGNDLYSVERLRVMSVSQINDIYSKEIIENSKSSNNDTNNDFSFIPNKFEEEEL